MKSKRLEIGTNNMEDLKRGETTLDLPGDILSPVQALKASMKKVLRESKLGGNK